MSSFTPTAFEYRAIDSEGVHAPGYSMPCAVVDQWHEVCLTEDGATWTIYPAELPKRELSIEEAEQYARELAELVAAARKLNADGMLGA